ncbi:FtsX-like permease family protein [Parashewanella spongiae]|uniref:FtsX-like permease family protein n=1 Tax=Parashewanella spongiae TaxID=342950 RepID=A0A3A6TKN4_9GAMM|nr:FtsX-like permease family protein [Parashewanella spongiae]MCL1078125.1 FtsX-like permease family protein [Parashewanella spongiae]RJY16372.1 FtsX-like permease family protein [Parashewanella spongiae]
MLHIKPIISSLLHSKSGPFLLFLQMMLSVAIIANASSIINQRLELMDRESGVDETKVLTFRVSSFSENTDHEAQNKRDQQMLRDLPNVINVSSTNMFPLSGGGWSTGLLDKPDPNAEGVKRTPQAAQYMGNEHFLDTLGLTLVEGRNFYPEEILHEHGYANQKVIVSKPLADEYWGEESPIGKILYHGTEYPIEVIGVVDKLQGAWVDSDFLDNSFIFNIDFGSQSAGGMYFVRANEEHIPELKQQIETAFLAEDPDRVVIEFLTVRESRDISYQNDALMVYILSIVIVLLLLVSSLGLAGMVMFNVQRRTKQIGTRRALGARKRDIINQFLVENYVICLAAGVCGGLLAVQLGKQLMQHYSLPALDLTYPLVTIAGLFIVTSIAVFLPARKAATISPAIATRSV